MGPTASGKTGYAVRLARELGTEIISADSMQIYRHMDIGTAKPDQTERGGIVHHMLDIIDPAEEYSAARYAADAAACADDIIRRGMTPIVVGGTGLYIDALLGSRSFEDEPDTSEIRAELERLESAELYAKLGETDPERAAKLHINDRKRVIRALEIFISTGETATARDARAAARPARYDAVKIGLEWQNREELYARINARVDAMFAAGLEDEARYVRTLNPGRTASQAIGYKELFRYFDGLCSLDEAREDIKRESRRYAKRQLTWLRRDKDIKWMDNN
jgi:tRNA dimethylallyltransferase